jgi:phenol/toluene 2-monooxygenase (NADH) P1/A1
MMAQQQFNLGSDLIKPIRNTYKYMSGLKVKRPTTYDEATYNLEPKENFHYRPLWNPEMNIFDERLTKVKCEDWEQFRDPEKLYYATYCYSRADFQTRIKGQFEAAERYGWFNNMEPAFVDTVREILPVLRHLIFGESIAFMYIGRAAVGTAVEQCATYQCYDELGTAQLLTKICLELEDKIPTILQDGKQKWLEDEKYQKLRALTERLMVTWDWAEAMIAANLVLDQILYPLFFEEMTALAIENGAIGYAAFSQYFMEMAEYEKTYTTALVKMLLADCPENKEVIQSYVNKWLPEVIDALQPALEVFGIPKKGMNGHEALNRVLNKHIKPLLVDELQLFPELTFEGTGVKS